ncbi:dTDP-4-dehydrorhamnose 3,5-epimerase [Paenibacillus solanacearum]|uniref:dTDP-4-dehydrorhamnose 3,5-epimerase n=1 Tax=Paenibacillus solanacearum TaxID=2048548 RepID=A0A916JXI7_9BACL|nr:dTDP-4-dehydrorhamnose 3,5-epimerase [Paenibacillus solanacearum]CAG7613322.1 dTDP-4-dehydrorhamnose 3,5-epimerase [Paenibacillus solanacearum]
MNVIETFLQGVKIIEPDVYGDKRGWFMETYSDKKYKEAGIGFNFVQDNQSFSAIRGTLRGVHYQLHPKPQTKLVRCTRGVIFDVAVDIRQGSPSFGRWVGIELSADNKKQLLIPSGFAHGFITLADNTEVQYKVDEIYSPDLDRGIIWNDRTIGIDWPLEVPPILSEKDRKAPRLADAENNFIYGD